MAAARRAPARAVLARNDAGPLAAVQAEAGLDRKQGVTVNLRGVALKVKPLGAWPASNAKDVKEQDFEAWARKCLVSDADVQKWLKLDPTYDEVEEFFTDLGASGAHPGK